ncbi:general transcription factor II-I repeat domain-containing protein 2B-like [Metopolophium dirhodum]|uniref:general transcription factor II-I repeat domain-containing protein 2B-like n=1 Tax=Metopolophium dirhodum TaxID=44670 RepID=UPI0029901660|nr:general transcription factor II-I repeat domain-containing protein 2B-like [Metopolophium dirhodum]
MSVSKKRKISDESRVFQEKWSNNYFFIQVKEKAICLICQESIAVMKEYNLKRHYGTKHAAKYDMIQGQLRIDKFALLMKNIQGQSSGLKKYHKDSEASVKASYIIAQKIAAKSKPFTDGEFIKECMEAASEILCPAQKQLFSKLSLSGVTVARRIEELGTDIESTLKERISKFIFYSLALDESIDLSDTAQLAIFVRGIDSNFNITEELAALFPMKGTTKSCDIFNALISTLNRFGIKLNNLSGVITDGAPSMVGKNEGLVALIKKEMSTCGALQLMQYHCIIHQENLCAKSVGFQTIMKDVVKIVNFIRSRALNHREFKNFLSEIDAEQGDVIYFTDVRKKFEQLNDTEWKNDFAYLTDITLHLNELNLRLQRQNQLIHNLFDHIKAFENKLMLWEIQLKKNNTAHFPCMSKYNVTSTEKYAEAISDLKHQFKLRFSDFKANETYFNLFSIPFSLPVEDVPENMQMEIIDLQNNKTYPNLRNNALRMMSLFGSTYTCEHIFSRMKIVKSKNRARLTDSHLESSLRIASSQIQPNINKLVSEKQCQLSH